MEWTRAQIDWPTAKVVTNKLRTTVRPRYKDKHGKVHLTNHVKTTRHDLSLDEVLNDFNETRQAAHPANLFDEALSWANDTLNYYQLPAFRKEFLGKLLNGAITWQYMSHKEFLTRRRNNSLADCFHSDSPIYLLERAGLYWSEPWHAAKIAERAYLAKLYTEKNELMQAIRFAMDFQEAQDNYYYWSQTTAAVCSTLRQVHHGGNAKKAPVSEVVNAVDDYLAHNPSHNVTAAYSSAAEKFGYSTAHVSRLYTSSR